MHLCLRNPKETHNRTQEMNSLCKVVAQVDFQVKSQYNLINLDTEKKVHLDVQQNRLKIKVKRKTNNLLN